MLFYYYLAAPVISFTADIDYVQTFVQARCTDLYFCFSSRYCSLPYRLTCHIAYCHRALGRAVTVQFYSKDFAALSHTRCYAYQLQWCTCVINASAFVSYAVK